MEKQITNIMRTKEIYTKDHLLIVDMDGDVKNGDLCYYQHPMHKLGIVTTIQDVNHSDYPPYRVRHTEGYGVIEGYKKIVSAKKLRRGAPDLI